MSFDYEMLTVNQAYEFLAKAAVNRAENFTYDENAPDFSTSITISKEVVDANFSDQKFSDSMLKGLCRKFGKEAPTLLPDPCLIYLGSVESERECVFFALVTSKTNEKFETFSYGFNVL